MTATPVCFVGMPFGQKLDAMGGVIDFDLVYRALIAPAVWEAGMTPVRGDEWTYLGLSDHAWLQPVLGAPVAVFDVSVTTPDVMYALGVRHALRPHVTLVVAAGGTRVPSTLERLRVLFYELNAAARPENPERFRRAFVEHLEGRRQPEDVDSPVFQVLADLRPPKLGALAEVPVPEASRQANELKRRILSARRLGPEELVEVEAEIGDVRAAAPEVVLTLFDAYRAAGAWGAMVDLVGRMRPSVASSPRVQEQLALALNRVGAWEQAEETLKGLLRAHGPSSETYGLLGRVFKDQWEASLARGETRRAAEYLDRAIDAYITGFEADWRDPYPGVNAVTLMTLREPPDRRRDELLPIVTYAVKRRVASSRGGDYWDVATLLELSALGGDERTARGLVPQVLAQRTDAWQSETTARNLRLMREALERRHENAGWLRVIEEELVGLPIDRPAGTSRPVR